MSVKWKRVRRSSGTRFLYSHSVGDGSVGSVGWRVQIYRTLASQLVNDTCKFLMKENTQALGCYLTFDYNVLGWGSEPWVAEWCLLCPFCSLCHNPQSCIKYFSCLSNAFILYNFDTKAVQSVYKSSSAFRITYTFTCSLHWNMGKSFSESLLFQIFQNQVKMFVFQKVA